MHAYLNNLGFTKILEDRDAIVKSIYTNEQNYMLYLQLPASEYLTQNKTLNLVLDQTKRKKDLYFNIKVHSSCNFQTQRAGFHNLKYKQKLELPGNLVKASGPPSSPFFYQSPQVYFYFDKSKVPNPALVSTMETLITFQSDTNADVKLFLVRADTRDRVTSIKENQLVDPAQKSSYYKPITTHIHYTVDSSLFYNVLASTYKNE